MANACIKSLEVELSERDVRYILYAISVLMTNFEGEIEKDPDGEEDITPMYADDLLSLQSIHGRLREKAVTVFGEEGLSVSRNILKV